MKIPFLLMNEEQRAAIVADRQITFLNTKTQNFDICPEAKTLFQHLLDTENEATQDEMKDTEHLHSAVHIGMAAKTDTLKFMQFRHYLGI